MKKLVALAFSILLMTAFGLQASPAAQSKLSGPSSHLTRKDFGKTLPPELAALLHTQDPAGDGLVAGCSADDCRVCNANGLMCTPTKTGCDCEFWDY
jgi:hypothetical protein